MSDTSKPRIGEIVYYQASKSLVAFLEDTKKQATKNNLETQTTAVVGQMFPLMVVIIHDDNSINGQLFIDGNYTLHCTDIVHGMEPGQWQKIPQS